MVHTRLTLGSLGLSLALVLLLIGCGIKSDPLPALQTTPLPPTDLTARTVENGVEVSFSIPAAEARDKQVVEAWLHYAYLLKEGDPDCPPCPPRLRQHYELNLAKQMGSLEGERFTYLDTQVPMDHQAVYQVNFIDARRRTGVVSGLIRALRVALPAAPLGLSAELGDRVVDLAWLPVSTLDNGQPTNDKIGYILYRKEGLVAKALNERPMTQTGLQDRSLALGQAYAYQVAAARILGNYVVVGRPSQWVTATPRSLQPPSAPTGLVGASMEDGIYLRFTPSPEQNTSGYNILRAPAKTGPWAQVNPALNRENTHVDRDVKVGGTYYYRVVAVNEGGLTSQPSEIIEVRQQP